MAGKGGGTTGSRDPGEPMAGKKRLSGFGGKRESRNHLSRFSVAHESPSGKTYINHSVTHIQTPTEERQPWA